MNEDKEIFRIKIIGMIMLLVTLLAVIFYSLYQFDNFERKEMNKTAYNAVVTVNKNTGKVALILYDAANDEELIYWMDYQRTDPSGVIFYYFE